MQSDSHGTVLATSQKTRSKTPLLAHTKGRPRFLPRVRCQVKLKFHDVTYELKVNHKDDIMTGQLYVYQFLEGHQIIVTKKGKNSYVLEAPDTKLYPEVD